MHKKNDIASPSLAYGAVWDDPKRCWEQVSRGRRMPRPDSVFRVGTWNAHWFPDGRPGKRPAATGSGTDVSWMACAIAFMQVDAITLQEVKLTPHGLTALEQLLADLKRLTSADWVWVRDGCSLDEAQHLLMLYRSDRVSLTGVVSHGIIDPTRNKKGGTDECPGVLRPGLGAYVKSKQGGVDFNWLAVHLDSGRKGRDYINRRDAWTRIGKVTQQRRETFADADVLVMGDFNSMGCKACAGEDRSVDISSAQEVSAISKVLAAGPLEGYLLESPQGCTSYYKGQPNRLDLIATSNAMLEAKTAQAVSLAVCGASKCAAVSSGYPIFRSLSDHCPVIVDLVDKDLD